MKSWGWPQVQQVAPLGLRGIEGMRSVGEGSGCDLPRTLSCIPIDPEENTAELCIDWEPWSQGPVEFLWEETLQDLEEHSISW